MRGSRAEARVPGRTPLSWADANVPIEMGRHLADREPGTEFTAVAGEGHRSLVHRGLGTVLAEP